MACAAPVFSKLGHKVQSAPGRRTPFKNPFIRVVVWVHVKTLGRTDRYNAEVLINL